MNCSKVVALLLQDESIITSQNRKELIMEDAAEL